MNNKTPSKKYLRWFGGALLLAAAAALVWAVYRPRPLLVEVATVSTGSFEQSIEEDGRLRLKNRYVITAPTPAELMRPTLKVGDRVRVVRKRGEVRVEHDATTDTPKDSPKP